MDVSKIRWSDTEYTLKEFVHKFKDSFPKIIKVTQGFLGEQELDSVSNSTLIHIHSLQSQKRAVVETKYGRVLSLPTKISTVAFHVFSKGNKPEGPFTLQSILEIYSLPVSVQPTKPLTLLDSGSCLIPTQNLQQLTITNTYQEEFLLGYCLSNKGTPMVRTPLVMPMYMKEVHLALAEGLEEQSQEQWETICNTLSQLVTKLGHMDHFIFQDITLLDKRALSEHGNEYTEMEPIYMKLQQDSRDLTLYEDLRTLAPTPSTTEQKPPPIPPKPSVQLRPMEEKTIPLKRLSSSVALPASYSSLGEVPTDLHGLSVTEVCDCLLMLNLHQYNEAFKREQIDGDFLYMLDTGMMRDSLGMSRMHIIKLLHFRDGWRPKEETFLL